MLVPKQKSDQESLLRIHNCFNDSDSNHFDICDGERLYTVCVKIDETLPWIELKRTHQTRQEAKRAAEGFRNTMQMQIICTAKKRKPMKALATIKQ
jgi:hypothetical protein